MKNKTSSVASSNGNGSRAHWSNRIGFILAAAGSAIGLGNIWKFPYITGVNGGGAFVLIYLVCIALVGVPILIAEIYIGQKGQKNAVQSFEATHRAGSPWRATGWMGVLCAFVILSFYSVVGGWVLDFEWRSLLNQFSHHSDEEIRSYLGTLFESPLRIVFWHLVFMFGTIAIVAKGVKDGIEKWNKILMPGLLIILLALLIYSFFLPGFGQALEFLFAPDASKLHFHGILEAIGHSFFTLSLGMGAMLTYGSYLSQKESLPKIAITIAFMDTFIALLAGVVIFSIVFSSGLEPGAGPTLMFQTLPILFSKLPGGYFLSVAFFLLVAFAAFTSAVSLLEVVVAYWVETHQKSRAWTAITCGGLIAVLGIFCGLSFNLMSEFKVVGFTVFDLFDKLSSQILLPLGGILISIFYGWVLGPKAASATVGKPIAHIFTQGLLWSARVIAPLSVIVMLVYGFLNAA